MTLAFKLYVLSIKAFIHRVYNDLLSEVVVALSSCVLALTFLYVFNDFLNVQVAGLSQPMRDRFAEILGWVFFVVAGITAGRISRSERLADDSFVEFSQYLGTLPHIIKIFEIVRYGVFLALPLYAAFYFTQRYLFALEASNLLPLMGWYFVFALSIWFFPASDKDAPQDSVATNDDSEFYPISMIRWRLTQMLLRSRMGKICMGFAFIFFLFTLAAFNSTLPPFVGSLAAYLAGLILSFAIIFQVAEDLESSWFERSMGVSHTRYVGCYNRVAGVISFVLGSHVFIAVGLMLNVSGMEFLPASLIALKAAVIGVLPIIITPWLVFQIDARRPAISIMILIIVSIFVATAVLAHWAGLVILPFLRYYALKTQEARFHRA